MYALTARLAYNVLFVIGFAVGAPYWLYRLKRRGHLAHHFSQRLGWYGKEIAGIFPDGADLWIHAVSVGETRLAQVLIAELRRTQPDLRILVSTTTATGQKLAQDELAGSNTLVIYNPFDFWWPVRSAFHTFRPRHLILIEAEIWPNFIWAAADSKTPIILVNARLSERSEKRYRLARPILVPLLAELSLVLAQSERDAERLLQSGFPPERIFVTGSMKYDVAALASVHPIEWWDLLRWPDDALVLLAASTHTGEEALFAKLHRKLRSEFPSLRLVIVPRHAERGREIILEIAGISDHVSLRTDLRAADSAEKPDALIVNTTGEMLGIFEKADLVFMGKSIRGKGGQNYLEAARFGKAIVVGPHMSNFQSQTEEFIQADAIRQVDEAGLEETLRELLKDRSKRDAMGRRAADLFQMRQGAGKDTARIIADSLEAHS